MPKVRVHNFAISLDGYAAGPDQSPDDGIEAARERALEAAEGKDVRIGGGAATIQEYLRAGLIDDMHLVIVPTLLGRGERLFDHLDGGPHCYECVELGSSPSVAHTCTSRGRRTRCGW